MIGPSLEVCDIKSVDFSPYAWNAVVERNPDKFVYVLLVFVYSGNLSLVFDTDSKKATVGICHGNNRYCKVHSFDSCGLSVKNLSLRTELKVFDSSWIKHCFCLPVAYLVSSFS